MRAYLALMMMTLSLFVFGCGDGSPCGTLCGKIDTCYGATSCKPECNAIYDMASDTCRAATQEYADCVDSVACDSLQTDCLEVCRNVETVCGVDANCM